MPISIIHVLFVLAGMLIATLSYSQAHDENIYTIRRGNVQITPAQCLSNECAPRTFRLSGHFSGFLPGGGTQLFFTSSSVTTTPDIDFQLPSDPDADETHITREILFTLDDDGLRFSGAIDSRAANGSLIEYFVLATLEAADFNSRGFFSARPDFRRCAFPQCGGYFVKKLNGMGTRCADGTRHKECYVAELAFLGSLSNTVSIFDNKTPFLFQGKIIHKHYENAGNLGVFRAKNAYVSATTQSAKGRYLGLENNARDCSTKPCVAHDGYILNRKRVVRFSTIDFSGVKASPETLAHAQKLLAAGTVLPVAGHIKKAIKSAPGERRVFVVNQFYVPVAANRKPCPDGYTALDGTCRTPHGCVFPLLELTDIGDAPIIDTSTGDTVVGMSKSCTDTCNSPAALASPGQCRMFYL